MLLYTGQSGLTSYHVILDIPVHLHLWCEVLNMAVCVKIFSGRYLVKRYMMDLLALETIG